MATLIAKGARIRRLLVWTIHKCCRTLSSTPQNPLRAFRGDPGSALYPQIVPQRVIRWSYARRAPRRNGCSIARDRNAADGRRMARPKGTLAHGSYLRCGVCQWNNHYLRTAPWPDPCARVLWHDLWVKGRPRLFLCAHRISRWSSVCALTASFPRTRCEQRTSAIIAAIYEESGPGERPFFLIFSTRVVRFIDRKLAA